MRIENLIIELQEQISKASNSLLEEFPIQIYMNEIKSYSELCNFYYISRKLDKLFRHIISNYNLHSLSLYHKLALSLFIRESVERLKHRDLPHSILSLYHSWFQRVLKDFSRQPDEYYNHRYSEFLKDLTVCSLRTIPVGGAWIVDTSRIVSGVRISRGLSKTKKAGPSIDEPLRIINYLRVALYKLNGFKPFYQIHTVLRYQNRFNSEERDKCYLRISELLKGNPQVKGMYAEGWLYDPNLENVSPELVYLRRKPEQNGAKVFQIGTRQRDIVHATAMSPTRRKLYQQGTYMPTAYALVWSRKELLAWADKNKDSEGRSREGP
jgi:hypothetical protein